MTTRPSSDSAENKAQLSTPDSEPSFGWNQYAEKINGRFAMIGFVALLIVEFITQQDFFSWLGLR
ncbi:MAG: chlorophyll a/b-binding protein [Cyanobacteria bacterium P01_D01_bin.105]